MPKPETLPKPVLNPATIQHWIAERKPNLNHLPDTFRKNSYFSENNIYTVKQPITIQHRTPASNKHLQITLSPQEGDTSCIIMDSLLNKKSGLPTPSPLAPLSSLENDYQKQTQKNKNAGTAPVRRRFPICAKHLSLGRHNLKIDTIRFCEHYFSMLSVLNLRLDCTLSYPSFPLPADMLLPFLQELEKNNGRNLKKLDKVRKKTFSRPFALQFESNPDAYVIFTPDSELHIDHQISYPGSSVGQQRIVTHISPEFFSFIAQARTNLFVSALQLKLIRWLQSWGSLPFWRGIRKNDILLATQDFLDNSNSIFDCQDGVNYEFISHEILDMLCWIKILENEYDCKWVGKIICYRFGHREQIATAKWLCNRQELHRNKITLEDV